MLKQAYYRSLTSSSCFFPLIGIVGVSSFRRILTCHAYYLLNSQTNPVHHSTLFAVFLYASFLEIRVSDIFSVCVNSHTQQVWPIRDLLSSVTLSLLSSRSNQMSRSYKYVMPLLPKQLLDNLLNGHHK